MSRFVFAALLTLCLASSTLAQAPATDTVFLPGGGRIRGTVEVYEPNQRVVVVLSDGTRRTLRRGQFERVVFADEAAVPSGNEPLQGLPPPPVAPAPSVPPPGGPQPVVIPEATIAPPDSTGPAVQSIEAVPVQSEPVDVAPRAFGDQRASSVRWPAEEPNRRMRPDTNVVHFGLQASAALRIEMTGYVYDYTGGGSFGYLDWLAGGAELVPYLDFRLALPFQIRLGVSIAAYSDNKTRSRNEPFLYASRSVFDGSARLLFGFLFNHGFALRIGPQVGFGVTPTPGSVVPIGEGILELGFITLGGHLEILLATTVGMHWYARERFQFGTYSTSQEQSFAFRPTIGLGYLF